MLGTVTNSLLIIAGAAFGLVLQKGIPERYQATVIQGLAMVVGVIGVQMALKSNNILIVIVSIALGALVGEALKIDVWLKKTGDALATLVDQFFPGKSSGEKNISEGFVTTSLIYCVGAMSVVGSIQEGLTGDASILYAKGVIDGITAIFFASSMGLGVVFSALPVFIYQGSMTLGASLLAGVFSEPVIAEMSATGGVLIMGISCLMLKITVIRIANLLPAIIFSALITMVYLNF